MTDDKSVPCPRVSTAREVFLSSWATTPWTPSLRMVDDGPPSGRDRARRSQVKMEKTNRLEQE